MLNELEDYNSAVSFYNDKQYDKAFKIFKKLAEYNKDSDSLYMLSNMYIFGNGVEKNIDKAIHYLEKAEENNHLDSIVVLAGLYYNKDKKDYYTKALKLYDKAYLMGDDKSLEYSMYIRFLQKGKVIGFLSFIIFFLKNIKVFLNRKINH